MSQDLAKVDQLITSDGYRCALHRYPAQGPVKARLVCLHGIQSHAGWYTRSSAAFAQAGYEVVFLDRRGSGRNEQNRGDTPSFRRLLLDLAELLQAERNPGQRTYLLAISWGGKLAVALERYRPGLTDGLLLVTPGLCPRITPRFQDKLRILWSRLTGPTRLFPIPLDDPDLFTGDPTWQAFIRADPLSLHQATARFLVESARLDAYLRWCPRAVKVPVLLLLAGQDRIIDNDRTREYVGRFGTEEQTVLEYPTSHHTLEFEAPAEQTPAFVADVLHWLEGKKQA